MRNSGWHVKSHWTPFRRLRRSIIFTITNTQRLLLGRKKVVIRHLVITFWRWTFPLMMPASVTSSCFTHIWGQNKSRLFIWKSSKLVSYYLGLRHQVWSSVLHSVSNIKRSLEPEPARANAEVWEMPVHYTLFPVLGAFKLSLIKLMAIKTYL